MHEMSLAQNIVEIVRQHVAEEGLSDVRRIKIKVGELAGVLSDSLDFCFSALVEGTPLGHATLDIVAVPAILRCEQCGAEGKAEFPYSSCANCNGNRLTLISGSELQVVEFQLDEHKEAR